MTITKLNSINLLIMTGDLDYCCGVSNSLYNLIKELKKSSELSVSLFNTGGDAIDRFKDLRVELITDNIFSHSKRSSLNFLKSIFRLRKLIKGKKINIVHSNNHYAANISYYASRFLKNVTLIQTNHGLFPDIGRLKHFIADKYIAVNDQVLNYIIQNNFAGKEDVQMIRCGISPANNKNASLEKLNDSINVFTASRLVKEKGIETFIRAASYLKKSFPGIKFKFQVAGSGDYLNDLVRINNDLDAGVEFLGVVSDMYPRLNRIDFFVMTSRSEGFPISIVEAGLAKKLVITSRFDGLEYVFQDGQDGLTFKIDDHTELAEKILFAVDNPELAGKLSANFHDKALKFFDPEAAAEKHLALYKACLARSLNKLREN